MWIILAFISACLLGCYDFFKKLSLKNNAVLPELMINTIVCALFFLPLTLQPLFSDAPLLPTYGWREHLLVLIKAAIVLSSWICGYFAIKHLPLTIVGPINATRPVMTLTGALLIFGEQLNGWQWAGVVLAIVSVFLLSRSGKKEGINFTNNRWIVMLIAAAVFGAASGLYDKHLMSPIEMGGEGLNSLFVQGWYNTYQALLMTTVILFIWLPTRHKTTPFQWRWSILCISLFLTAADMAYFFALSEPEAMISIVSMVRRGSVVVSFLFGAIYFQEKNLRAKAFDMVLVLLGMLCLYIGTA